MARKARMNPPIANPAGLAPDLSRRGFVATASAAAVGGISLAQGPARAAIVRTDIDKLPPYGNGTLPPGIRSRAIANVNGLTVHILEAGYQTSGRPAVLLLHGFPELAYSWRTAEEMAQIPTYYVMERDKGMAATVAPFMPSAAEIAACKWLAEAEVEIYATEYARTQFTGALQGYRVRRGSDPKSIAEMHTFSGRTIDVPSMFIGGKSDWGVYQTPGAAETMQKSACTRMVAFHRVDGAGHWVQQEQPEKVSELLIAFLREQSRG